MPGGLGILNGGLQPGQEYGSAIASTRTQIDFGSLPGITGFNLTQC